ncbi:hypothetical protein [Anaerocaecibacter muris]|nr:hypothetical protein [Anaerocaecibacter muris]
MDRQIKKDKAIELMKALDIYKPYIFHFGNLRIYIAFRQQQTVARVKADR